MISDTCAELACSDDHQAMEISVDTMLTAMEISGAATATTATAGVAMEISMDTMLTAAAGAAAATQATATQATATQATNAAVTTTMGLATSNATDMSVLTAPPAPNPPEPVAWDAHLENPCSINDPALKTEMQTCRRAALGLTSERVNEFMEACEFVSLGCFCAPSYGLQLLGTKRNSYPFDWVRSSLEGVVHCVETHFEDFLTYSTFWVQDQYTVFGGTRWGGSFWHHNLEAPTTLEDMTRRAMRFYGHGEVPSCKARFFVRCVNSTRELHSAVRLRDTLRRALPEAAKVFLLLIVDLQETCGAMSLAGEEGLLFYRIQEAKTQSAAGKGQNSLRICAESYAQATAFAIAYWAEGAQAGSVSTYASARELAGALQHWDGGDPARELFNPRRFYGQQLLAGTGAGMRGLLAKLQMQSVILPPGTDVRQLFPLQCFGKRLLVRLPETACPGQTLQLCSNDGVLSGMVSVLLEGAWVPVGPVFLNEEPPPCQGPAKALRADFAGAPLSGLPPPEVTA